MTLIRFRVGPHQCALTLADVDQVVRMVAITPLSGASKDVAGMINLRGEGVPVVDLGRILTGRASMPTTDSRIIIAYYQEGRAGLVVDEVLYVLEDRETKWSAESALAGKTVADGDLIVSVLSLEELLDPEQWGVVKKRVRESELPTFTMNALKAAKDIPDLR